MYSSSSCSCTSTFQSYIPVYCFTVESIFFKESDVSHVDIKRTDAHSVVSAQGHSVFSFDWSMIEKAQILDETKSTAELKLHMLVS